MSDRAPCLATFSANTGSNPSGASSSGFFDDGYGVSVDRLSGRSLKAMPVGSPRGFLALGSASDWQAERMIIAAATIRRGERRMRICCPTPLREM